MLQSTQFEVCKRCVRISMSWWVDQGGNNGGLGKVMVGGTVVLTKPDGTNKLSRNLAEHCCDYSGNQKGMQVCRMLQMQCIGCTANSVIWKDKKQTSKSYHHQQ